MSAFTDLMITGEHRYVILQAHANLGLPEPKPWGSGAPWKKGDSDRYQAELNRISSDPVAVQAAVNEFSGEVERRQIAERSVQYDLAAKIQIHIQPNQAQPTL
jgi:hypothetical protein